MKFVAYLIASLSVAGAFAPQTANTRLSTALSEKKSLASTIFEMDLFAPVKDQNDYGARSKKNLKQGKLGSNSYVPAGLTKAQYEKIRSADKDKKDKNYQRNVAKAGKFESYDDFYMKRGTNLDGSWKKSATLGHRMVKTKYDYSGEKEEAKVPEAFSFGSIFGKKK